MKRGRFLAIAAVMVAVGAAVRVNNAMEFPGLRGYDGFGHFTYIWYLAETGRVPLSTAGWSFFHPPLYYAWMAMVWKLLSGTDPVMRLKVGTLVLALLSLVHAGVSYVVVRRYFPGKRLIHLLAVGLMLFLPVHLYSVGFLGNEGLNAIASSISLLLLLWVLKEETWQRAALLGLSLGLAMLVKFTALAVVAGAFGTIGLRALFRREPWAGARTLAVMAAVMLLVCGWFYGRNIRLYGNPFQLSRDEFMVQHVEHSQPQAERSLAEYLLFDPLIFRRPVWPRGFSPTGDLEQGGAFRALRESVWTGVYANAWFDGFGGWVLPPVTESELARRAGQALLCLGTVPTGIVVLGMVVGMRRLWRFGWDDTLVAMVTTFVSMVAIFIHGTRSVPIPAAVKATYFIPVAVPFSFWLALGLDRLSAWRPAWLRLALLEGVALALLSVVVFWQGFLFRSSDITSQLPFYDASLTNLYGIVYYAGGNRDRARQSFEESAEAGWHLAFENLAYLAADEHRYLEALHLLRRAARLQLDQATGRPADRLRFIRSEQAEYENSLTTLYHALGWQVEALHAATEAVKLAPTMPEARYNLGVLQLAAGHGKDLGRKGRKDLLLKARSNFETAVRLDEGLVEASAMLGVLQALNGDCRGAEKVISEARSPHPGLRRKYPVETGTGAGFSAAIGRRHLVTNLARELRPEYWLRRCSSAGLRGQATGTGQTPTQHCGNMVVQTAEQGPLSSQTTKATSCA